MGLNYNLDYSNAILNNKTKSWEWNIELDRSIHYRYRAP